MAPRVVANTRVLVLGSLPGEASLAAAEYYAHPQNAFWRLTGAVIGREDLPALAYEDRIAALLAAGIGLWDTVASAQREGSLDSAMRTIEPRDLAAFAETLPALRAVGFNGATAAKLGRAALGASGLALIDLPSSSPAFAAMPFADKCKRWLALRPYLAQ